jgi:Type IV secretory system Conjugative DNA transfer
VTSYSDQDGTSDSRPVGNFGPNGPGPGSFGRSTSLTISQIARKLVQPNEIRTMPDDMALVFHQNMQVLPVRRIKYYQAPEFKGGRTGRSRGLGLAGVLLVTATVAVSLWLPMAAVTALTYLQRQAAPALLRAAAGQPGYRQAMPYGRNRYRPYPVYPSRLRRYSRPYDGF